MPLPVAATIAEAVTSAIAEAVTSAITVVTTAAATAAAPTYTIESLRLREFQCDILQL